MERDSDLHRRPRDRHCLRIRRARLISLETKERSSLAVLHAEHETWNCLFLRSPRTSPLALCIGTSQPCFAGEEKKYSGLFHFGENVRRAPSPKSCTRKREEATRQQGGFFCRENSSNGGKAIRTFWRNTKFGKIPCQGQNWSLVSLWWTDSYGGY